MFTLGIDPAPAKSTVACIEGREFVSIASDRLVGWFREIVEPQLDAVIAWDAPLSFDSANGFSDRPIDRDVRAALKKSKKIAEGAVSVLPFSGCPHWAVSAAVLGHPFGIKPLELELCDAMRPGRMLLEVHPAVTLATWWIEFDLPGPLPRYKPGGKLSSKQTRGHLQFVVKQLHDVGLEPPDLAGKDDDHLDAWIAWKMAEGFAKGTAAWVGSARAGGYVLPIGATTALGLDG